jgi:ribosome-associated translation inhibitor RaiA
MFAEVNMELLISGHHTTITRDAENEIKKLAQNMERLFHGEASMRVLISSENNEGSCFKAIVSLHDRTRRGLTLEKIMVRRHSINEVIHCAMRKVKRLIVKHHNKRAVCRRNHSCDLVHV